MNRIEELRAKARGKVLNLGEIRELMDLSAAEEFLRAHKQEAEVRESHEDHLRYAVNRAANRLARAAVAWDEHFSGGKPFVPAEVSREYYAAVDGYKEATQIAQLEDTR